MRLSMCAPPKQVFATPKRHPKSKPFFDHVLSFSVADGRIWLRNYQVGWCGRSAGWQLIRSPALRSSSLLHGVTGCGRRLCLTWMEHTNLG